MDPAQRSNQIGVEVAMYNIQYLLRMGLAHRLGIMYRFLRFPSPERP